MSFTEFNLKIVFKSIVNSAFKIQCNKINLKLIKINLNLKDSVAVFSPLILANPPPYPRCLVHKL